jgi:hypothetical protein
MASSDPNAISRMMTAATKPMPSLENSGGFDEDVATQLDACAQHVGVVDGRPGVLADLRVLVAVAVGQVDLGVGDGAVVVDVAGAVFAVRADDLAGRDDLFHLSEEAVHSPCNGRIVHVVGLEDDLAREPGTGTEAVLFEQVDRLLALRAG